MTSVAGLFAHIVKVGGYPLASLPLEHFPVSMANITMPVTTAWLVRHGIVPGSPNIAMIEEYTQVQCNVRAQIVDLNNTTWDDEPRNLAAALCSNRAGIPSWAELQKMLIFAPSTPVGLAASDHAPKKLEVDYSSTCTQRPYLFWTSKYRSRMLTLSQL